MNRLHKTTVKEANGLLMFYKPATVNGKEMYSAYHIKLKDVQSKEEEHEKFEHYAKCAYERTINERV